jgi:hypothetical protein
MDYYAERLQTRIFAGKRNFFPDGKKIAEPDASIALAQFRSLDHRIRLAVQRAEIARIRLFNCNNIVVPQFLEMSKYVTRLVIQSRMLEPRKFAEMLAKAGIESRLVYGDGSRAYDGANDSGLLELPWVGLSLVETEWLVDRLYRIDQEFLER